MTFDARALVSRIDTAEQLIPDFEIESRMIRLILDRLGMMKIMLKRRIDDRMMSIRIGKLMAPMQINPIAIEEHGKLENPHKCVFPCHFHANDLPGRKEGPY